MREILMIDDKFSKWYPILEKSASEYDFNISNAPSVEEGLGRLENYPDHIDAVILGLSFSTGKMQGKEGLLKIKEIDNCIPVIILTAKTDDFQLISECIRLGAHDYFSKPTINPGLLFLQIESAIQQSNQRKKLINIAKASNISSLPKPYLYFTTLNEWNCKGYFAYRLKAVASASFGNKSEAEYLCNLAWEWHFNFLNTLSYYESDIKLRLRYLFKPGAEYIDPVLVIEFRVPSHEQAMAGYNDIHTEFEMLMHAKKDFGKTVYYFSPVVDEKDLKNILFPFNAENFVQFTPEFDGYDRIHIKGIGFSSSSKIRPEQKVSIPLLLKPEIKMDSFCEQLINQKTKTMVEVVLSPVKLTRHEIDHLRELSDNINLYHLNDIEKEKVFQTISSYLQAPSKCFNVEIFETQELKRIGENLVSAISTTFFESATHVNTVDVNISRTDILKNEDEIKEIFNWNSLYSLSNIVNVFKFPYPFSSSIPGIKSYQPAFGFTPSNISKTGVLAGVKNVDGTQIPIKIRIEDLRKHLYLLGQTGTGKTTVLYSMIMERIKSGKGVCVIDPHGDLYVKILTDLPENRIKDVILFDPGDLDNTIRINLLEYSKNDPREKSFMIDELFNFFKQEYEGTQSMGPAFESYMKNALLLLMDDPDNIGSIGNVSAVFQDSEFRNKLLDTCKDINVVNFWRSAGRITGDWSLENFTIYITSKLNQLLINEYIRPIVVTHKSNINFREVIDNDQILLVSLPKGKIGKIGVNILGTVILSRIINAALSRENTPEDFRKDFTLFVDEFQNFASQSVMFAMSEARKYRLSLVIANQTLGQLSESMRQSVLGNVGSTIFFRPGINDVDYIMPYFTPYLTRENVLTLPNYKCIGRLQIDNMLSLPFIFDTIPPENSDIALKY